MSFYDLLSMCLRNLVKRKLRTMLTMLGVVIGTAALVLTISLTLASEARFQRMADEMGQDMSIVNVQLDWTRVTTWTQDGPVVPDGVPELDDDAIRRFESMPGVVFASPQMSTWFFLRSGPYEAQVSATGMSVEALQLLGLEVAEGRFIEEGDTNTFLFSSLAELNFDRAGTNWMDTRMMSFQMGEDMEGTDTLVDVLNDSIQASVDWRFIFAGFEAEDMDDVFRPIPQFTINVAGVLAEQENRWANTQIYTDIGTVMALDAMRREAERENDQEWGLHSARDIPERTTFDNVIVKVEDPDIAGGISAQINDMGFTANYAAREITMMREGQETIQTLLIGAAAVSIFVAAISIANTMIMAVYERTREIGVMKVIGGAIKDIRRMFLLEAALIGFIGGIFGVLLSLVASHLLNMQGLGILTGGEIRMWWMEPVEVVDQTSMITGWLCGAALVFASAIGLISGYFPARRATKLSALAAIRTD